MISLISKKLKYTHLIKINESMRKFNRRVKERNRYQARQCHQGSHRSHHWAGFCWISLIHLYILSNPMMPCNISHLCWQKILNTINIQLNQKKEKSFFRKWGHLQEQFREVGVWEEKKMKILIQIWKVRSKAQYIWDPNLASSSSSAFCPMHPLFLFFTLCDLF